MLPLGASLTPLIHRGQQVGLVRRSAHSGSASVKLSLNLTVRSLNMHSFPTAAESAALIGPHAFVPGLGRIGLSPRETRSQGDCPRFRPRVGQGSASPSCSLKALGLNEPPGWALWALAGGGRIASNRRASLKPHSGQIVQGGELGRFSEDQDVPVGVC